MNLRFRLFIITLGGLLVIATFAYPTWVVYFQTDGETVLLPELEEDLREAFTLLPQEEQTAYLQLRASNPTLALQMLVPALRPVNVVPDEEQIKPRFEGEQELLSGAFNEISPIRKAEGTVTLYELPDGSRYLWLDGFNTVPGPGLRLFLTRTTLAELQGLDLNFVPEEELVLKRDDLLLDPIRYTLGSQSFSVPTEANLANYNSVMIFSTDLNIIYSLAPLS